MPIGAGLAAGSVVKVKTLTNPMRRCNIKAQERGYIKPARRREVEIEKKYRLGWLPLRTMFGQGVEVAQGYLFTDPGELRVRRKGFKFFVTVKGDGDLSRKEWESDIPEWVFETLWAQTEGRRVEKTRYTVAFEGLTLEVDEYHGELEGLLTPECEFSSEEEAHAFCLPEWAASAVDVTADKAYKNKNLAVKGLPKQ